MRKPTSFLHVFTDTGPLVALAVAIALLIGIVGPASAQFFNFGGPPQRQSPQRGGGWFGGDFFQPFQQQAPQQAPRQDFSRAPGPAKRDTVAERNVLVLGDAMADWLGYGLEDAYSEQPDMGVIRKHKTVSGLIKYQPRGEPADWIAAAKAILATEKPDAIVVMLGLHDRVAIREAATEKKTEKKDDKKDARGKTDAKTDAKPADAKPADPKAKPEGSADAAKRDDKPVDAELSPDDAADNDTPQISAPEKSARSGGGLYEFRDERWVELYAKKIEELIGVLKSKGVPVLWVGLPAIRGQRGTSDMLYLDALYRDGAGKAGITYVDVWDGFVDEAGRFLQKGPDFEGQIRQLRAADGVFFTKAGARKLAHYVEREVTRLLAARSGPIAVPIEPVTPDANVVPGQPAPRPLAGPVMPLVASNVGTDQLLGGPGSRPASVDALAARTLVKGEALAAPAGRADDYAWPRREIGREQARGDTPVAAATPSGGPAAAAAPAQKQLLLPPPQQTFQQPRRQQQQLPPPPMQIRPAQTNPQPSLRDFFGGFGPAPRPPGPPPAAAPRGPANPGAPRPPGSVGRSAEVPPGNLSRF
ncbi:SGNH/GDSL hydrolase family protein [Bradyrhizobium roseum]|uniref:SGNH/GDSL hydrolase family protein n=1 Tax=Bradyrhizobium roseum TaxID=3056648 RepID=UPI002636AAD9|nr:SGNH family hydrolase [Bradyrhizobium roseus]WKA29567.1 SGNH family hydrolase [Bradyrhizobium roseus]